MSCPLIANMILFVNTSMVFYIMTFSIAHWDIEIDVDIVQRRIISLSILMSSVITVHFGKLVDHCAPIVHLMTLLNLLKP